MSKKLLLGMILFLFSSSFAHAQFTYEAYVNYGYSIFGIEGEKSNQSSKNKNELAPSYSIGAGMTYPLIKQRILVSSGIDYTVFTSDIVFSEPDDKIDNFYNDYHRLRIPLLLSIYNKKEYFRFNVGITNNFRITEKSTFPNKKSTNYNIGSLIGIDVIINKHLILGIELSKDITPTAKGIDTYKLAGEKPYGFTNKDVQNAETVDFSYHISRGSIKIGYKF